MRRTSCLSAFACLLSVWAWHQGSATEPMPRPDDGTIANGTYTNKYFRLSYPLPSGWAEAMPGPSPSPSGSYVLATLTPGGEATGTILIGAQDTFFVALTMDDPAEAA